jgi:uncharacterized protein (DUF305 family)
MTRLRTSLSALALALFAAGAAGCRSAALDQAAPIIQPGAPGTSSRVISPETAEGLRPPAHTTADVQFMQGMIAHHAQALEMVGLLKTRTSSDGMRKLAQRIEISQQDEIEMMQEWLEARGADAPGEHAHHAPGAPLMPGMLTAEDMQRLAAATGPAFDNLFLEYMIRHHEGALVMVKDLFARPGAGQESDIHAFASDVDADQRMEIARMAGMLKELER